MDTTESNVKELLARSVYLTYLSDLLAMQKRAEEERPGDRSELDKHFSVFLTEFTKLYAYYYTHIARIGGSNAG